MERSDDHQVISLTPSAKTYYGRAMIAYEKTNFERAKNHFKTGISLAKNEEEKMFGHIQLALIHQHSFEFEKSVELFDSLLNNLIQRYHEVYFFQATNYLHLKEYNKALSLLEKYIEGNHSASYKLEALEMKKIIETQSKGI